MGEAIAQDPENANLYYNLGVVTADLGDKENARAYYEKAIAIDPSMENGYLNLVALILEDETSIVEEMNSLGNSRADNAKYDILKGKRESVYSECVPILKKLISISESNQEAARTLMNIYATLGDNEGFMEMKKLLE
jgi:tetratricopeptide (TPR) repeat protein